MSYDIYLYKSKSGRPDIDEASEAIEDLESTSPDISTQNLKTQIAKALINFNPRLEVFNFDYAEIARLQNITVDEAKPTFSHIEINTPEDDLATQITIFDKNVSLTIPYWYSDNKARELFKMVDQYLKIIHRTSGYLVFDPQTGSVYNPNDQQFDGIEIYEKGSARINKLRTENTSVDRPWWKFW